MAFLFYWAIWGVNKESPKVSMGISIAERAGGILTVLGQWDFLYPIMVLTVRLQFM